MDKATLQRLIDEVPDENDPSAINYWKRVRDKLFYLEGWVDECLSGTGFPPMERGETEAKIAYIEDLTPGILKRKAKEVGLKLLEGGFRETPDAESLYGVTYGVFQVSKPELDMAHLRELLNQLTKTQIAAVVDKLNSIPKMRAPHFWRNESKEFNINYLLVWADIFTHHAHKLVEIVKEMAREGKMQVADVRTAMDVLNRGCREAGVCPGSEQYHAGPEEGQLTEREERVAERAAVQAAELTASRIAEQVAKELSGEVLHSSPVSPHCQRILEEPPSCVDFRGIRSFVLCRAWAILETQKRTSLPVGEAWAEARQACRRE